jgi:hypothetical protein
MISFAPPEMYDAVTVPSSGIVLPGPISKFELSTSYWKYGSATI